MRDRQRAVAGVGVRPELIHASLLLLHRAESMGFGADSNGGLGQRLGAVLDAISASQVVPFDVVTIRRALDDPTSDAADASWQLHRLFEALGESRAPQQEAAMLVRVFGVDQLAELLVISPTSVRRYARGERLPPSVIADRLHWLALVVGHLSGTYNDYGVRRWFDRPRGLLDGAAPKQVLLASREWTPHGEGAREVEQLAKALIGMPAT